MSAGRTLAELRAESKQPERRSYTAYVGQGRSLVAEIQALTEELALLPVTKPAAAEDRNGPPSRIGEGKNRRAIEIEDRLAECGDELAQYAGVLQIAAAKTHGEWRRWCLEHPARQRQTTNPKTGEVATDGDPGWERDVVVTGGHCNADDLIDDLATYVMAWNDEPLAPGDLDLLGISLSDLKAIARMVVFELYEYGTDLGKVRAALSATVQAGRDSRPLSDSASPRDASSDGNPRSDTPTSTPTDNPVEQPTLSL